MPRKIIVGLGNPGREYFRTRHNLGFWALDLLAEKLEAPWQRNRFKACLAQAKHDEWDLTLAEPVTYMNLSGEAVQLLLAYHKVPPADLIVVCDDVSLPVGKIRIRTQGSAGGHHGLESIIGAIGTSAFTRIRLGIKPLDADLPADLAQFVLAPFRKGEEAIAAEAAKRASEAILVILEEGVEQAMNKFNRDPNPAGPPKPP